MLTACSVSKPLNDPLPPIPGPQVLPDGGLGAQDALIYWMRDRANLKMCVARQTPPAL